MAVIAPQEKLFQEMTRSRAWPQGHRGGEGGLGRAGAGGAGGAGSGGGCQQVGTTQGPAMTWVQSSETHILHGTKHILLLL